MALQLYNQHIYNNLIEPILVIDRTTRQIIYCNNICANLRICSENTDVSELSNVLINPNTYDKILNSIHSNEEDFIMEDLLLHTFGEGIVRGNLRTMYLDSEKRYLYMIFQYNQNDMRGVFLKSRCFESIYTLSYSYPFHLDVKNKVISFIGTVYEDFNVTQTIANYPEGILDLGVIHEDDIDVFRHVVDKMYLGEITQDVFRSFRTDGEPLWYHVRCVANRDTLGNPIEVIGEFVNVQDTQELKFKSRIDELTGCLNKSAFHDTVHNLLGRSKPQEKYALFIIDMDNFKAINDNLGHPFGDSVLREVGEQLLSLFGKHDYVGRIGGDEFMVFSKLTDNTKLLDPQSHEIMNIFNNSYRGNANIYHTTASIGISLYPQNGEDFQTLYEHADIALYHTKSNGKNNYTFYHEKMEKSNANNTTPFDSSSHALSQQFDQRIIAEVFTLLTEAKDYSASVNKALALLGTRFNVSRCYIFEYSEKDTGFFNNTYEWCAKEIESQINNLQNISSDVSQPLHDLINDDGMLFCDNLNSFKGEPIFDIMKSQGIQSCLLSFNKEGDDILSMVGFDDCKGERTWQSNEIFTLMQASKIINQFLKYIRAMDQIHRIADERLHILDELYSYSYIVDKDTCEIMYFNQEFEKTFPNVKLGDYCYHTLQGKSEQCDNCPMIHMTQQQKEKYRCTRVNRKLKKTVLVNLTKIGLFEGRNCMFFSCSSLDDIDE